VETKQQQTNVNPSQLETSRKKENISNSNKSHTDTLDSKKEKNWGKILTLLLSPQGIGVGLLTIVATGYPVYLIFYPSIEAKLKEAQEQIDKGNFGTAVTILQSIKDTQKSQWRIVRMLTNIIRSNSEAPEQLNISDKSRKVVLPIVRDALDLIKGRNLDNDSKDEEYKKYNGVINLRKTNLQDINFIGAKIPKVSFDHSDLYKANLTNANLKGAYLRGTYLRVANFTGANLANARLDSVKLENSKGKPVKTDLIEVTLTNANLNNANFAGVVFFDDKLKKADLKKAKSSVKNKIKQACNWYLAKYSSDISKMLDQSKQSKELDSRPTCQKFKV
jgi:hypothetical protein